MQAPRLVGGVPELDSRTHVPMYRCPQRGREGVSLEVLAICEQVAARGIPGFLNDSSVSRRVTPGSRHGEYCATMRR